MEPIEGRFQSESESLRTRGANDVNPIPRAEQGVRCPNSFRDEKKFFFLPPLFVSTQASKGLNEAQL